MQINIPDQALIGNSLVATTAALAPNLNVPANVQTIITGGYATKGDNGSGIYTRFNVAPTYSAQFQTADGAYWGLNLGSVNPIQFGAVGDGATDSTTAFTNMEAANSAMPVVSGSLMGMVVNFLPGVYLSGPITKRSYAYIGAGYDDSVLKYNGAAGSDFITQSVANGNNGANSSALISAVTLDGQSCRDILVIPQSLSGYGVDDRYRHEARFRQCSSYHINIDAWVNYHQEYNRHDNPGIAAIYAKAKLSQNLSSFAYGKFTYDNNTSGLGQTTTEGFAVFDNTAGASNVGDVHFYDARIEFNKALAGKAGADASKAYVFKTLANGTNQSVKYHLEDLTIQSTTAGDCLTVFYRDNGGVTTGSETFILENVQVSGVTNMFAGDYPAWMKAIPVGSYKSLIGDSINGIWAQRVTTSGPTGLVFYGPDLSGTGKIFGFQGSGIANEYWAVNYQGTITSGGGGSAPVLFARPAGSTGWSNPTDYGIKTDVTLLSVGADLATTVAAVIDLQKRYSTLTTALHLAGNVFGFLRN